MQPLLQTPHIRPSSQPLRREGHADSALLHKAVAAIAAQFAKKNAANRFTGLVIK
jgi:hypothetical protein